MNGSESLGDRLRLQQEYRDGGLGPSRSNNTPPNSIHITVRELIQLGTLNHKNYLWGVSELGNEEKGLRLLWR